jgi:hypothetical protein
MQKMMSFILVASALCASTVYAQFSSSRRSINGTGEVLPAKECELSLVHLACGVSETLTVTAPTAVILTGQSDIGLRQKFMLGDAWRVTPRIAFGTPIQFGVGADLGWDIDPARQHSLTIGAEWRLREKTDQPIQDGLAKDQYTVALTPSGDYTYYWSGHALYAGATGAVPYLGATYSFGDFFLGLVTSPKSRFVPLPYAYVRF